LGTDGSAQNQTEPQKQVLLNPVSKTGPERSQRKGKLFGTVKKHKNSQITVPSALAEAEEHEECESDQQQQRHGNVLFSFTSNSERKEIKQGNEQENIGGDLTMSEESGEVEMVEAAESPNDSRELIKQFNEYFQNEDLVNRLMSEYNVNSTEIIPATEMNLQSTFPGFESQKKKSRRRDIKNHEDT